MFFVFSCVLLLLMPLVTLAQETNTKNKDRAVVVAQNKSFTDFLKLLQSKKKSENITWNDIKQLQLLLSTEPNSPINQFHFESIMHVPKRQGLEKDTSKVFERSIIESKKRDQLVLRLTQKNTPFVISHNSATYQRTSDDHWQGTDNGRWTFQVRRDHMRQYSDITSVPRTANPIIVFNLQDYLQARVGNDKVECRWDNTSQTLVIEKVSGTTFAIRFRSPSDTVLYGTALGEIRGRSPRHAIYESFRSFQTRFNSKIRLSPMPKANYLKFFNIDPLLRKNNAKEMPAQEKKAFVEERSVELWNRLAKTKPLTIKKNKLYPALSTNGKLYAHTNMRKSINFRKIIPQVDSLTKKGEELFHLTTLTSLWEELLLTSADDVDSPLYSDDPALLWRMIEAKGGARNLWYLVDKTLVFSSSNAFTNEQRLSLVDHFGDCGYPPFLGDGSMPHRPDILKEINKNLLLEAVLFSRWKRPCSQKHIDICLKVLADSKSGSEIERVVAETLIRLNELPQIPTKVIDRWFEKEIITVKKAKRRYQLSVLTFQPTGRDYLLKRIQSKKEPDTIRNDAIRILQSRAKATLKTKRFDFISEKKCKTILSLTITK